MALSLLYDQPNRRRRQLKERSNPLAYDDIDIIKKYRLSRELIIELTESLYEDLSPQTQRNHAISVSLQVFTALRFFAIGAFQELLGDSHGLSKASLSRIIKVSDGIVRHYKHIIKFPSTEDEGRRAKCDFYGIANFPGVLGCLNGTLVPIIRPSENEHLYVSRRKGGHAINVQLVCSANMLFTNAVVRYPATAHDAFIWASCALKENLSFVRLWRFHSHPPPPPALPKIHEKGIFSVQGTRSGNEFGNESEGRDVYPHSSVMHTINDSVWA